MITYIVESCGTNNFIIYKILCHVLMVSGKEKKFKRILGTIIVGSLMVLLACWLDGHTDVNPNRFDDNGVI